MCKFIIAVFFSVLPTAVFSQPSAVVRKADFGDKWPLRISEARLECRDAGKIVLIAGGKTYWFNGLANGAAAKNGWANLEDIWIDDPSLGIPGAKKSIGPLNDRAHTLCL